MIIGSQNNDVVVRMPMTPIGSYVCIFGLQSVELLGGVRRYDHVGRGMSLEMAGLFRFQKLTPFPT